MKTKIAMIAALAMMALTAPAKAEESTFSFGVVDMSKVMANTTAAKDVFSQLEEKRKQYQTDISKEENALRSAEQDIMKQKDSLARDEFDKQRKGFEEKVIKGQKLVQDRKRILDQAFNSSMLRLRGEAAKIVATLAKERKYSAVFTQEAVMMSTPEMDMTEEVISRMNKELKKISVDWSASADDKKK